MVIILNFYNIFSIFFLYVVSFGFKLFYSCFKFIFFWDVIIFYILLLIRAFSKFKTTVTNISKLIVIIIIKIIIFVTIKDLLNISIFFWLFSFLFFIFLNFIYFVICCLFLLFLIFFLLLFTILFSGINFFFKGIYWSFW